MVDNLFRREYMGEWPVRQRQCSNRNVLLGAFRCDQVAEFSVMQAEPYCATDLVRDVCGDCLLSQLRALNKDDKWLVIRLG